MIEKMKKLTLLSFYKDREQLLTELQEFGVLHIETVPVEDVEEIEKLEMEKSNWQRSMDLINMHATDNKTETAITFKNPQEARDVILNYAKELEHVSQRKEALHKEENQLLPWGDFSWKNIERLQQNNIYYAFCMSRKRDFSHYDFKEMAVEIIQESGGFVYFVIFSYKQAPDIPFDQVALPHTSLAVLREEREKLGKREIEIIKELAALNNCMPLLKQGLAEVRNKLTTAIVDRSFNQLAKGNIIKLTGWFPVRIEAKINDFLQEKHLSYVIDSARLSDRVPVVLKNKNYPKIFETVTKIFQLPNYHELDLTPLIAVFYPIFFAYCLGDAGYGFVLVIISVIGFYTFFKKARNLASLILVLGLMTTVVGIIKSGTVFGLPIAEYKNVAFFAWLSNYILVTDNQDYTFNAFNVALMIGVVQILVGVVTSIVKKVHMYGWKYGIGNFGKLIIIIGILIIFLGGAQKIQPFVQYTGIGTVLIVAGILLVLLFHNPDISLTHRLEGGILPLYFIFTGFMGDTLSYIRLFALGIASSILGLVINKIGAQIMSDAGIGMHIVGIIFLVFGHTVNLTLSCLGAFVHPLRLTFVEFYNNANFEGGGVEYRPFKKEVA